MRRSYTKPSVTFEKLSMNANVSAGCSLTVSFAEFVCPIMIEEWGETVFTKSTCDWSNDDVYICYHVPTAGTNIFGS